VIKERWDVICHGVLLTVSLRNNVADSHTRPLLGLYVVPVIRAMSLTAAIRNAWGWHVISENWRAATSQEGRTAPIIYHLTPTLYNVLRKVISFHCHKVRIRNLPKTRAYSCVTSQRQSVHFCWKICAVNFLLRITKSLCLFGVLHKHASVKVMGCETRSDMWNYCCCQP
jgi:hypothetical protein